MPEAYWSSMKEELEQQQREIDQKKKQVVEQDEINQEKQKGQEDKAPVIKKFIHTKERTKIVGAV